MDIDGGVSVPIRRAFAVTGPSVVPVILRLVVPVILSVVVAVNLSVRAGVVGPPLDERRQQGARRTAVTEPDRPAVRDRRGHETGGHERAAEEADQR